MPKLVIVDIALSTDFRYDPNLSIRCGIASGAEVYKNFESILAFIESVEKRGICQMRRVATSQVSGSELRDNLALKY